MNLPTIHITMARRIFVPYSKKLFFNIQNFQAFYTEGGLMSFIVSFIEDTGVLQTLFLQT